MMHGRKIIFGLIFVGFSLGSFLVPIAPTITIAPSGTVDVALAEQNAYADTFTATLDGDGSLNCPLTGIFCGIVQFVSTVGMFVSTLVTVLSGLVLDFLADFSLSSQTYGRNVNTFIEAGWTIIRDVANILFIFGLLLAAFYLILQPNSDYVGIGTDPKKIVLRVIIMALLVNFSLFFTKVIIDAGNIPGRVFMNRITEHVNSRKANYSTGSNRVDSSVSNNNIGQNLSNTGNFVTDGIVDIFGTDEDPGISLGIISASNPQKLLLDNYKNLSQFEGWYLNIIYLFVAIMVFVFNLGLIFIFIVVGFLFAARTFGLWLAMIMSPLAFVLHAVPIPFLKSFTFSEWFKKTIALSFMAPVFMFFVYLAILFLGINNAVFGINATSLFGNLIAIAIKLVASMFIILQGKKIATDMSGEVGRIISGLANTVAGLAVGGAVGGTAFMARQTLGRAGARVAASETLRDLRAGNVGDARDRLANKFGTSAIGGRIGDFVRKTGRGGWFDDVVGSRLGKGLAQATLATGRKVDEQSFDARDTGMVRDGYKKAGIDLGDKFQRKGGYTKNKEEDTAERMKKIAEEIQYAQSSKHGVDQQDIDKKQLDVEKAERDAKDTNNPAVANVEKARKAMEDAEKQLTNPANAAAAAVVQAQEAEKEYLELTKATFDNFKKDLDDRLKDKKYLASFDSKIPPGTPKKDREKMRRKLAIEEFETANPEYKQINDRRAAFRRLIDKKKKDPSYQALKKDIADTRTAYVSATQDAGYKTLQKAIKDAQKAFKDAQKSFNESQAKRLESIAKEYEQWIDTSNRSNTAFDTEFMGGDPMSGEGRMGRTYEGFFGSTTGVRGGAKTLRDKAREWRDKNK